MSAANWSTAIRRFGPRLGGASGATVTITAVAITSGSSMCFLGCPVSSCLAATVILSTKSDFPIGTGPISCFRR
ncbi:unnamed protein product, partial [Rhizophagus irregularis]